MDTSCLFSIPSDFNITYLENPLKICYLNFVVDDFLGLFLHIFTF